MRAATFSSFVTPAGFVCPFVMAPSLSRECRSQPAWAALQCQPPASARRNQLFPVRGKGGQGRRPLPRPVPGTPAKPPLKLPHAAGPRPRRGCPCAASPARRAAPSPRPEASGRVALRPAPGPRPRRCALPSAARARAATRPPLLPPRPQGPPAGGLCCGGGGAGPAAGEERAGNGLAGRFPRRLRPGEAAASPRRSGLNLPRLLRRGSAAASRPAEAASVGAARPSAPPRGQAALPGLLASPPHAAAAAGGLFRRRPGPCSAHRPRAPWQPPPAQPLGWLAVYLPLPRGRRATPARPTYRPLCSWRGGEGRFPCGDARLGSLRGCQLRARGEEGRDGTDRLPPPGGGGRAALGRWLGESEVKALPSKFRRSVLDL